MQFVTIKISDVAENSKREQLDEDKYYTWFKCMADLAEILYNRIIKKLQLWGMRNSVLPNLCEMNACYDVLLKCLIAKSF